MADGRVELEVTADTSKAEKEIDGLGDAAKQAGNDAESAGGSAFQKVQKGAKKAEGDADGLGSASKQAGNDAEGAGAGAFKKVVQGAQDAIGEIDGMSSALGALGGALSLDAIVGGMTDLTSQAAETNSYMSRLEASAQKNNVSAQSMGATYSGLVGVLGDMDRSVETSGNLFALCGDNQERLSELTTALTGAYSQFGDGLPIEGLAEAANETAKVGTVTGSFADALNWVNASQEQWNAALQNHPAAMQAFNAALDAGMSKEDAFNAALASCTTEQERAQLVTQTLSSLYGEQGAAYEEANEDAIAYRQSQDEMNQALSEAGEEIMPIVTEATKGFTDALGWFTDNGEVIIPIIAGIAAGIAALTIVSTVATAVAMLSAAFGAASAPILIVIGVIALLVAGIVALAMNAGGCRDFLIEAFNAFVAFVQSIPERVETFLSELVAYIATWAGELWAKAQQAGSDFLNGVISFIQQLPGRAMSFLQSVISNVGSFVSNMASKARQAGQQFLTNIVNELSKIPGRVVSIGRNIVDGIVNGIKGAAGKVGSVLQDMASNALDSVMGLLGIHSPSKVFRDKVGKWIPYGAAEGVEDYGNVFNRAVDDVFSYSPSVEASAMWTPAVAASGGQAITQTINFNQPVQTPDQTAKLMRRYANYGLAGAR